MKTKEDLYGPALNDVSLFEVTLDPFPQVYVFFFKNQDQVTSANIILNAFKSQLNI